MEYDIEQGVAREYAQAAFNAAQDKGTLAAVSEDLHGLGLCIKTDAPLRQFLQSPVIDKRDKESVLVTIFQGRVHPLTLSFLRVAARRQRLGLLGGITRQFQQLMDEHLGIERGEVVTARPLASQEQARLDEELSRAFQTKLVLSHQVDEAIVGGMVVTVGDRRFDGSVRSKLRRFTTNFTHRQKI